MKCERPRPSLLCFVDRKKKVAATRCIRSSESHSSGEGCACFDCQMKPAEGTPCSGRVNIRAGLFERERKPVTEDEPRLFDSLSVTPSQGPPRSPLSFRPPSAVRRSIELNAAPWTSSICPTSSCHSDQGCDSPAPLPLPCFSLIHTSYALISAAPPPPCTCCSGVSGVSTTWSVPFFSFFYAFVFLYPIFPLSLIYLPCVPPT